MKGTTLKTNRSEAEHGASASQVARGIVLGLFLKLLGMASEASETVSASLLREQELPGY